MSDATQGYPNDSQSYQVGPGGVIKGRAVKPGAAPNIAIACTAAGDADLVRGVAYQSAQEGEWVLVVRHGSADVEAPDATVTDGAALTINALGQFVRQAAPQVTETVAYALEPSVALVSGAAGPYIKARIMTAPREALVVAN